MNAINIKGQHSEHYIQTLSKCVQSYENYKKFMGVNTLPDFEPEYFIDPQKSYAKTEHPDDEHLKYRILFPTKIIYFNEVIQKSIFYHEFTHIEFDYLAEQYFKGFEKVDKLTKLYSEYYSSRVDTMALLGFNSYNENKCIHKSNKLYYPLDQKLVSIDQFLNNKRNDEINNITANAKKINELKLVTAGKYDLKRYNNDKVEAILFWDSLRDAMYYLGSVDLCTQYCKEPLNEFWDFSPFAELLGDKISDYFQLVTANKEINFDAMENIHKLESEISCDNLLMEFPAL